jgi:hypothetical protein
MANIHVTSTTKSIVVDFKDLHTVTPNNIRAGCWTSDDVFLGKYDNYVGVTFKDKPSWEVSFDGLEGTFQIDLVNGVAPTDNNHLFDLLAACKN